MADSIADLLFPVLEHVLYHRDVVRCSEYVFQLLFRGLAEEALVSLVRKEYLESCNHVRSMYVFEMRGMYSRLLVPKVSC